MTTLNKVQAEDSCPNCARYQKQIARLKKEFIAADDESLRRYMQLENKISKFKVEKEWLEAGDISISQSKKKAEKVGTQNSNTGLRASSSFKGKELATENRFSEDKNESYAYANQGYLNGDCGDKMSVEDKRLLPANRFTKSKKRRLEIEAGGDSDIILNIQKRRAGPEYYAHTCHSEGF